MKTRIFTLLMVFVAMSSLNSNLYAQLAGEYIAIADGDYNTVTTWGISDGIGGTTAATLVPTTAINVWIPVGRSLTNISTAALAKDLHIAGTLISGVNTTTTKDVSVNGNLFIEPTGVLKSTSSNAGSVGTLKIGDALGSGPCTIQVYGQLGSASLTDVAGCGFRVYCQAGGTTTVQGSGKFNIARFQSGANTRTQSIVIDMDMNVLNSANNGKTLSMENGTAGTGNKTLTINAGKVVRFIDNNVNAMLGSQESEAMSQTTGNITYDIQGTLNTGSKGGIKLTTSNQAASSSEIVTLKIGATGKLILGTKIVTKVTTPATQSIVYDFADGSTVEFAGATAAAFTSPLTGETQSYMTSFSSLILNSSVGLTLPAPVLVRNNLTLTSGILATAANTLTINGTISGTGTIDTGASGTLAFAGTSEQMLDAANVSSGLVNNLVINAGSKLTTSGTLSATNLTINSDVNGPGTLKGTLTSNNATVNQSLQHAAALRTWYLTSPVASASPAGMSIIKSYDEETYSWSSHTPTMLAKVGYQVVPAAAANDISFTGILNSGNQSITLLSRAGTVNKAGFNLIGNPYPSFLDWDLVTANSANTANMRSTTMWYRTKSEGVYSFWTVNGDGVGSPNGASSKIPPMQAFWVRAIAGGGSLELTNAMCTHAPVTDKLLKAPAAKNTELQLVRLQVSNGTNTDEAVIYFSANAANGMDIYDAPKMSNDNVAIPEIYTTRGTERIVINAMNSISFDTPVGLGFVAGDATSFSIRANEVNNLPSDVKVILKDNVSLAETDLTDGVSTYQFSPEVTSVDRFSIIFRSSGVTTGLNKERDNSLLVYSNNNHGITMKTNDEKMIGTMVSVYNTIGQLLISKQMTAATMNIDFPYAPDVYMVKVNNITKKVIVK